MELQGSNTSDVNLNLSRTRITILVFNLTIISLMLKMSMGGSAVSDSLKVTSLTSGLASFNGFCLTLLGLIIFLSSQRLDIVGNCKLRPFMFGTITTYLALSQTVTAFMHEFLIRFRADFNSSNLDGKSFDSALAQLDHSSMIGLYFMGGILWFLITYVAPIRAVLSNRDSRKKKGTFILYYLALQIPIYLMYAKAWQLEYIVSDQSSNLFSLFLLQFIQPLLWVIP